MKRLITMLAGLTVLATAGLASAFPSELGNRLHVQSEARRIDEASEQLLRVVGFNHRGFGTSNLAALQKLHRAAEKFRASAEGFDTLRLKRRFEKLERSFAAASREVMWMRRAGHGLGVFRALGREISDLAPAVNALCAAPAPMPPTAAAPQPTYTVSYVPPSPPPAPTVVYTTPGTQVSWYRTF